MSGLVEVISTVQGVTDVQRESPTGWWWFTVGYVGSKFWLVDKPPFDIGDIVKVTITKEPKPDAQAIPSSP